MRKGFDPIYTSSREITNLKDMLYSGLKLFGDNPLFLEKSEETKKYETVIYKDYVKEVECLGTALIKLGLKDTNLSVIGENRYRWAVGYMAIVNGVGTVVPIDKLLPIHEIMNIVDRVTPSAIIYSGKKREEMEEVAQKTDAVKYFIGMDLKPEDASGRFLSYDALIAMGKEELENGNRKYLDVVIDPNAVRILLFTSATTSTSKAAKLSHYNIASNVMSAVQVIYMDQNDRFLSLLPLHHTFESTCGYLLPIYMGASIAYCEGLKHIVDNLKESGSTIMLGVPLLFEGMYKKLWKKAELSGSADKLRKALKISNFLMKLKIDVRKKLFHSIYEGLGGTIRMFISGAAAMTPKVAEFYRNIGLNFFQGYGLTETSPILSLNSDTDFIDASAGKAIPGVEVQIWEPNEEGIGEIVAKGPNVMEGYLDEPELNKEIFEGGYFHTGDMGYMDDAGFIFITGRKKCVIVTQNGKNIYPEEIELLINVYPFVIESMVFGHIIEDSKEELITVSVYPDAEAIQAAFGKSDPEFIEAKVREMIREVNSKLVDYKKIKNIKIRNKEFIKTTTSKIKRYVPENRE
ncbi:MAG: AMP-binding protein [Clostridiales bacterium]|nr:AMP-binding protein [Clostridiales bacterium]